ncbi:MAG: glycosyltransferase family 4 protein [Thermodesulfobacteriota bacterium]|nr:glycosyltransferase family 4 protein [Thermodesulfobacteriota bacterium]
MENKKILHIITRLDKGGSAENTLLTALELNKDEYDVVLVKGLSLESEMSSMENESLDKGLRQAEYANVKLITIPSLIRRISPLVDLKALFKLYRVIRKEKPLIVHTHTSKAGILGRLASLFARVPIVVHTPHGHIFYGYYGKIKTKLFVFLEKIMASITDKMITLTEGEKQEHIQFNVAKPHKFVVIPSGVRIENLIKNNYMADELKTKMGIPSTDSIVGTIGRLVEVKGHRYFIDAARLVLDKIPKVTFMLVGDGHLMEGLTHQSSSIGIKEKVIFTGWRSDIPHLINLFDIFVLPSLNEGMGRVLVEAMAMRKPIVASSVGGILDLVKDGSNGILFPQGDTDAMAEAIIKLLMDKELAKKMGEEGKKRVYPAYELSIMIKSIEQLYKQLLKRKSKAMIKTQRRYV